MKKKEPMFEYVESIANLIPAPFYWLDLNGRFVGLNDLSFKASGAAKKTDMIGKNVYELYKDKDIGDALQKDINEIIRTGKNSQTEDVVVDVVTGKLKYFSATRSALRSQTGEILGVLGISIEITAEKEAEQLRLKYEKLEFENRAKQLELERMRAQAKLEEEQRKLETILKEENKLKQIIDVVDASIYWKDKDGRYLGCNKYVLDMAGLKSREDIIGKTDFELIWKNDATRMRKIDESVIETGSYKGEEYSSIANNKEKLLLTSKNRLLNHDGKVIGIVGTSLDISDRKEKERLEIENLNIQHQVIVEAQEKFKKIVGQMMHDMTSPIASINTIVSKLGSNIPENDRVTLRAAADRMEGISGRLLKQYENKDVNEQEESVVASLALIQIMNEKKEEHLESGVNFIVDIDESAKFCFIQHNSGILKRMISNLVNNAVDALKNMDHLVKPEDDTLRTEDEGQKTEKKVIITLSASTKNAIITIEDNGPGMPKHIQDMFNKGESMTEGKGDAGHGIGLTQVHDAITFGNGEFEIYATDKGTEIKIKFPLTPAPHWIATEVKLTKDDTILVLDDDKSIHGAWDHKFKEVLAKNSTLKVEHFTYGKDAIAYINKLTSEQKQSTFLLTDYELLEQGMNGLDVVEETQMKRAILVTSYATKANIQERVTKLGVRTLPKELVTAVEIKVDKKLEKGSKVVDMVWVEDQDWYVDGLVKKHYSHLKIDVFYDPVSFMECVIQYPLNTKIILDTFYEYPNGEDIYMQTGYDLAKELHALGYTKLILLAGEDPKGRAPEYLQVVRKKDDASENLDKL